LEFQEGELFILTSEEPKLMITLKQCKLTPEDYIEAQYLHMRPSPWLKYFGIALMSLLVVVLVALVASSFSFSSLISVFGVFVYILIFWVIYAVVLPWNVRRIFSQQKTLQGEYETVISPEMLEATSENGTMRMRLSDFYKYKVGKDLILLYQSQALFHMFPRRFFSSEEDFKMFRSFLEANLGSPKR
jgi:membrane protein implicated in regulation of membrane protease activity